MFTDYLGRMPFESSQLIWTYVFRGCWAGLMLTPFVLHGSEASQRLSTIPWWWFVVETTSAGTIKGGLSVLDTSYLLQHCLTVDSDLRLATRFSDG